MTTSNNIKVGLLVASLEGGGAERMMVNLANDLAKNPRISVVFYLVNKKGPYVDDLSDNIEIIDLKAPYGVKSIFFKLRNLLKTNYLDVIISTHPHVNTVLGIAGSGLSAKPIIIFREANTPSAKYLDYGSLSRWIYKSGNKFADHYVAVSDGVKEDMMDFYSLNSSKITRIYNPLVDDSIFKKAEEPVEHPWFHQNEPVIITMGRVVPQKDHLTLIRAFSLLTRKRSAKLLILGEKDQDPDYLKKVHRLIDELKLQNFVELAGFRKNPFKYVSKASLFVLSSRFEGLPGALVQAMACGCKIVSTNCPSGPAEILDYGKIGDMVPVGNAKLLAQAMEKSLNKQNNPGMLKRRALDFSVQHSAEKYIALIDFLTTLKQSRNE